MFSTKEFGTRIRNSRIENNLTQEELANILNASKDHISRLERGIGACSLELLIELSEVLHTSTDYLLIGRRPSNDSAKEKIRSELYSVLATLETL